MMNRCSLLSFGTIITAAAVGFAAQPTEAVFANHIVEIRWSGECADIRETNTFTASSPTIVLTAATRAGCSASLGSASFSGNLSLTFPEMSPPGNNSVDHFVTDTPMQVTAALTGTWTVQSPTNRFTLSGSGRVSATSGCPDVSSTRGPPLNPGSYPISLSAVCNNPLLFLKENNETDLLYEIESSFDMAYRSSTSFRTPISARVTVRSHYRVSLAPANDAISLSAIEPSPGTELVQKAFAGFSADLPYTLSSRQRGDVVLQAFDPAGNLLASSEIVRVLPGTSSVRQLEISPFELPFVDRLVLKALLIDGDSSTVLAQSSITYNVGPPRILPFQLGFGTGADFRPTIISSVFGNDEHLEDQLGALLVARVEVPPSPKPRVLALTTSTRRREDFKPQFDSVVKVLPGGFSGEAFITTERFSALPFVWLRLHADTVTFQVALLHDDGTALLSELIIIPAETISVPVVNPPLKTGIIVGSAKTFTFTLDLSTAFTADRLLRGVAIDGPAPEQLLFSKSIGPRAATRLIRLKETVDINLDTEQRRYLEIHLLNNQSAKFARTERLDLTVQKPVDIPAGSTPQVVALNAKLTLINSTSPRAVSVTAHRQGLEAFIPTEAPGNPQLLHNAKLNQGAPVTIADLLGLNRVWEFTPPIPDDGSFSASLTLEYDPDDFPDDPRFSESRMQIISWVPARGELIGHPTTINPTNRTATTPITSLAQFYTLGVTGSPAPALFFPLWRSGPKLVAAAQLLNLSSNAAVALLTAYRASGFPVSGVTNPFAAPAPAGLTSRTLTDLFSLDPAEEGWVEGFNGGGLTGSIVLQSATRSEALVLPSPASAVLFTDIRFDSSRTTEVHIANSTRFPNEVALELRNTNGVVVATNQIVLGPKGKIGETVQALFTNATQPFAGYLIARGTQRLIGMELVSGARTVAALNGQPLSGSTRLYAPRFTSGNGFASELVLVNPTSQPANVTLRAVNDAGANLTAPASISLGPGGQLRADVAALLGLSSSTTAGVICESSRPLVGALLLRDATAGNLFAAALPMQELAGRNWALTTVPLASPSFRELSVMNTNSLAATIAAKFFLTNATLVATTNLTLEAGARTTRDLATLLPASATQTSGYFLLESSLSVIVSGLTGETSGNTLSPLPAQTFTVPTTAPVSAGHLEVSTSALQFASVTIGESVFASLNLSNSGTGPLQVQAFSQGNPLFNLVSPAAPLSLAAGSSQSLLIRFSPDSTNQESDTLFILNDDPAQPVGRVGLSGAGSATPAPSPPLTIRLAGDQVTIVWPAAFTDFVLETTSALSPGAVWTEVANVVTIGAQRTITVTAGAGSAYYRLRR